MNKLCQHFIFLFFVIFYTSSLSVYAVEKQSIESFSQNKLWHNLLHYKQKKTNQSYVTSNSFFLDKNGSQDPYAELLATITAFYHSNENNSERKHPQCRFPARFSLITKNVELKRFGELKPVECVEYNKWRKQLNVKSISVVFASGYMSNPASMYGHLFLKLNSAQHSTDLLNTSINYGAIVPKDENPIIYVLRGIFGGYDAGFSDQDFYRHHHNYGDIELRDMWEYKLALSFSEVDFLMAHLWEILGVNFDYFFVDENCAFHIAKFLEIILKGSLIADDSLWVLPSSVAKGLAEVKHNQKNLLSEIVFIPSRETKLQQVYTQLSPTEVNAAQNLIDNNFDFSDTEYHELSPSERKTVIEALFEYNNVIKHKNDQTLSVRKNLKLLMNERINLPVGRTKWAKNEPNNSAPHFSNAPSKFSLGFTNIEHEKNYLTAGFRMTYFDDLSSNIARAPFSNLEMIDITLIAIDEQLDILDIDLIHINSLYQAPLPWNENLSSAWSVRAGYEQLYNNCFDCGIYFAEGSLGRSIRINTDGLVYSLVGGKIYAGKQDDISLSLKLGYITSINESIKIKLELKESIGFERDSNNKLKYLSEINYQLSPDWEIRFVAEKEESFLISVKMNYFWGF